MKRPSVSVIDRVLKGMAGGKVPVSMLGAFSGKRSPFQLLIATILSARSRDEVTEVVAANLFKRYPSAKKLAAAKRKDVVPILRQIGFYRQKSKHIIETARILLDTHGGRVPKTLEELTALPGVGRKVANCVLVYAFGIPAIAVDTHVHRISNRLGWVKTEQPEKTESELASFLPRRHWLGINDTMVCYGKAICRPIGPKCGECAVSRWCAKRI